MDPRSLTATAVPAPRKVVAAGIAAAAAFAVVASAAPGAAADGSAWTRSAQAVRGRAWTAGAHLDPGLRTLGTPAQHVIVPGRTGAAAAAAAVRRLGGTVDKPLEIVDGVAATVPAGELGRLAADPSVAAVTADRRMQFEEYSYDDTSVVTTQSPFVQSTGASTAWAAGNYGKGVGVAVIDTGISAMNDFAGRVVYGPDLSGEGTTLDSYGHGTVMAGAIGGSGADSANNNKGAYTGIAPKSTLVSVKVAGRNGVVDVSTILQAMHWVSAYQDQFNIRVLNLAWGTSSTQDPAVDPLDYAVERLWKQGIVVVVSAGNSGPGATTITKPGDDPLVITAGGCDDHQDTNLNNDSVPDWSSRGPTAQGLTKPDVVVPGRTLITPRSYGSYVEV